MNFVIYLIIGALAGWGAGKIMQGGGFGVLMNIVLGIVGGVIGGWVFSLLGISTGEGNFGSFLTALVGAVLLLYIARLIKK